MKILQILQHKDTTSYMLTTGAVAINFTPINEILTTLILIATLTYWIQKIIYEKRRSANED